MIETDKSSEFKETAVKKPPRNLARRLKSMLGFLSYCGVGEGVGTNDSP
jgi:hypothetical protein